MGSLVLRTLESREYLEHLIQPRQNLRFVYADAVFLYPRSAMPRDMVLHENDALITANQKTFRISPLHSLTRSICPECARLVAAGVLQHAFVPEQYSRGSPDYRVSAVTK